VLRQRYRVEGGKRLAGTVTISGSKNAALYAFSASLLTGETCVLRNVPDIGDVEFMAAILQRLGAEVERLGPNEYRVTAAKITTYETPSDLVANLRASFLAMGPLLARFGEAACPPPGGDVIGLRPLDVHLAGFRALGATVQRRGDDYVAVAPQGLRGALVFLDYPSVMGTLNVMLAACLAKGATTIVNAAAEPEIADLARMLNAMGAVIRNAGNHTVEIEGVSELHGVEWEILPDRIEAGTFVIAGAMAGEEVEIVNARPEHLQSLLAKLEEVGVRVRPHRGGVVVCGGDSPRAVSVQALPYPGFATDIQAPMGALLTQADGVSFIHERVYDNRLLYVAELRKLGGAVVTAGSTAVISGPTRLQGTTVRALDIRAGAALVLAGLVADGTTEIMDIFHLDRGYERLEEKLQGLGAVIHRV
jgi:UDP-N-acetylglucosamine 1-carboxyvinyltransferase